jgi:hypothetical protein
MKADGDPLAPGDTNPDPNVNDTAGDKGPQDQALSNFELRKQRIDQDFRDSMFHDDTQISILGSVGTDLEMLQLQVGEALREVLGSGPVSPEVLSENREGIEMFLKISGAVTSNRQLLRKMRRDFEELLSGANANLEAYLSQGKKAK